MGRIYIDSAIGSDDPEIIDLDPADYHWLDGIVDGTMVTQKIRWDPWRPLNATVGPNTNIPIMDSRLTGDRYFIVMDHGTNVAPLGTIDLGTPGVTLDELMTTTKANEIRAVFGLTLQERNAMRQNRVRQACKWLRWQGTRGKEAEFAGLPGEKRYQLWSAAD